MKAVIVGCGNIGAVHAESIRRLEGVSLCAAADIRPERAASYAEKYGCRAYASLEEMLEKERPDVLHICAPHYLHVPMTTYALQRGIHVFCEKPPVISEEQLGALTRAAAEGPGRAGFCFQNRYNPGVLFIRELLASGRLGKIKGARGIVTWNRGRPITRRAAGGDGWRRRAEARSSTSPSTPWICWAYFWEGPYPWRRRRPIITFRA